MIHDPSPKFAGAGTLPLLSEARSNLRHNQYAPSCQPSARGRAQSEPAQRRVNIKGAGSAQNICWVSQVRFMTRARAPEKVHHDCQVLGWAGGNPLKDSANQCPFTL